MHGLHLTADLHHCQCASSLLVDGPALLALCEQAVQAHGLTVVGRLAHGFDATQAGPGGVTATVLLAESHVCLHTWPELQAVTLDVYVCNLSADHSAKAEGLMQQLIQAFAPQSTTQHRLQRGQLAALAPLPVAVS